MEKIKKNRFTQKIGRRRRYPTETIIDAGYTDDLKLFADKFAAASRIDL